MSTHKYNAMHTHTRTETHTTLLGAAIVSLILQVQSELCHFMTQFFFRNKVLREGFWSNQWTYVGGKESLLTEYEAAAAERQASLGQPLLPERRQAIAQKVKGTERNPVSTFVRNSRRQEANSVEYKRDNGEKEWTKASTSSKWQLNWSDVVIKMLAGWLLLVGTKMEVLWGQLETQRVGSKRIDHVLVAIPSVLHQERTPIRLRGTDQLQALQDKTHSSLLDGSPT